MKQNQEKHRRLIHALTDLNVRMVFETFPDLCEIFCEGADICSQVKGCFNEKGELLCPYGYMWNMPLTLEDVGKAVARGDLIINERWRHKVRRRIRYKLEDLLKIKRGVKK